ncbi:uncharacterized protein EI90DRAFT_57278 [Cantharellus anzutake]|uniref:uncharacterized protein n=1 Tax=Cantharellus anzutake TaxID=1750568 RepID=UPI001907624E|nr:uncharacterized protein EI90DRAFT_57278 [Cantharellus anzutake]KAF8344213.1 hypothetical protein EI90DRAFT_57278 [Cantharellus anzutake]
MHRNYPLGISPPGHTYWSRSALYDGDQTTGSRTMRGMSGVTTAGGTAGEANGEAHPYYITAQLFPGAHRSSAYEDPSPLFMDQQHHPGSYRLPFPIPPHSARTRQPRISSNFPVEFLFSGRYTLPLLEVGRAPSPVPSYEEPKFYTGASINAAHPPATASDELESQPLTSSSSEEGGIDECPICFEGFSPDRPAVVGAPCGHTLCKRCWDLIVEDSKQAMRHSFRGVTAGEIGEEAGARCHACRMPYVRKKRDEMQTSSEIYKGGKGYASGGETEEEGERKEES